MMDILDVHEEVAALRWTVAEARQKFSELLRLAAREPQPIYNRSQPVAAVVDMATYEEFVAWRSRASAPSIGEAFADLRRLLAEEDGTFHATARRDRDNAFLEALDEPAR